MKAAFEAMKAAASEQEPEPEAGALRAAFASMKANNKSAAASSEAAGQAGPGPETDALRSAFASMKANNNKSMAAAVGQAGPETGAGKEAGEGTGKAPGSRTGAGAGWATNGACQRSNSSWQSVDHACHVCCACLCGMPASILAPPKLLLAILGSPIIFTCRGL